MNYPKVANISFIYLNIIIRTSNKKAPKRPDDLRPFWIHPKGKNL